MHEFRDESDNFLLLAPTYKILAQASIPTFMRFFRERVDYSEAKGTIRLKGKSGTCWCRSLDNPDAIVGVPNVRFIWGDEAGLYSLYAWQTLQGRAAPKEARVILTTSPYSLNWLYREIILPKSKDPSARPDVELIQATSKENPYFPEAEYERQKSLMDTRRFNMMFGGRWDRMEGLVYDCFSPQTHVVEPIDVTGAGWKVVAGIDFGFSDPFVLTVRAISPGGNHYIVSEHYQTGLTVRDMIRIAEQKRSVWNIGMFFCDPSRPENIAEFCRAGLPAVGANNDVKLGIDIQYELIKAGRFRVFKDAAPHTIDEFEQYHWPTPEDLTPDKDGRDRNPVKQWDHCQDSLRYSGVMTARLDRDRKANVISRPEGEPPPTETHDKRIDRLTKSRYRQFDPRRHERMV
jgi:hypothetical protein